MVAVAYDYAEIPVRPDGFTISDLDELRPDGRRYELLDGTLIVSPSPRWEHQWAVRAVYEAIRKLCPPNLEAFPVPLEVSQGEHTYFEPDLVVVRNYDLVEGVRFRCVPVLVVEVVSPSSRGIDNVLKRHAYARIGVPHYWIVDIDEPAVVALRLVDGGYAELARAEGDEVLAVGEPFPVELVPDEVRRR
jgi:Uma2 family endonuclease